jgi:hypothetical protein
MSRATTLKWVVNKKETLLILTSQEAPLLVIYYMEHTFKNKKIKCCRSKFVPLLKRGGKLKIAPF